MTAELELFDRAVRAARSYMRPVGPTPVAPTFEALDRLSEFDAVSLDHPIGAEAALDLLAEVGSPATMRSTGGMYFGFVNGGVTAEALAASTLAGAWDQNAALPVMSPTASAIDAAAARMMIDILGLPATATAAFCAGATIANITAIVAARDRLLAAQGWSVQDRGLAGSPPIRVVAGAEAHVSVFKALRVAGVGSQQVDVVPCDDCGRLDPSQLPPIDGPTLVLLQAGNVNTGHSDPFDAVIDRVEAEDTWVHVDGAFGLWANAVPDRRDGVRGVERAQSWATDAHKWLNAPYDCGVVICADGDHLRSAMRMDAAYVPTGSEERSLMNLGLQMSQAARAVPIWAILAARGRQAVAEFIEHTCWCAERFATQLRAAGFEILAPVVLNQVLVAFGDDRLTDRIVEQVQADGVCWMGATTWRGRRAMRISVSDFATTREHVDLAVASVVDVRDRIANGAG